MRAAITFSALIFGLAMTATALYLYWAHEMYGVAAAQLLKIGAVALAGLAIAAVLTAVWAYATRPRPPAE